MTNIFHRVISKNRYFFVTLAGLLSICVTGIVFSFVLQNTLPGEASAAVAENTQDLSGLALETAYSELGSGTHAFSMRERDIEYVMQEGDSLYSIGKLYVIDPEDLKNYNEITDARRIPAGMKIIIPSRTNLENFNRERDRVAAARKSQEPVPAPRPASILPAQASISFKTDRDGLLVKARFSIETTLPDEGIFYKWDMGDGTISQKKIIDYTFLTPGTYNVTCTLRDKYGYEMRTNPVSIEVSEQEGSKIVRTMYLTVDAVGEVFPLQGRVAQTEDFLGNPEVPVAFVEARDDHYFYRALRPGYFYLIARSEEAVDKIYLFVSPMPSVHNDRFDMDWYRTQYETGPSNCGPASVSMAIGWALGKFVPISAIRSYLGWHGDGGTSIQQLLAALQWQGVKAELVDIASMDDLVSIISEGKIAIILYRSGGISWTSGKPEQNAVGRYYADSVGHYIVVKGNSRDGRYFVVYDPIPSDWINNGKRYGDGMSMIGRNRYYAAREIASALILYKVLVISR